MNKFTDADPYNRNDDDGKDADSHVVIVNDGEDNEDVLDNSNGDGGDFDGNDDNVKKNGVGGEDVP